MASPTYATDAQVIGYLTDTLPDDVDTAAERAAYITNASRLIESLIGKRFGMGTYSSSTQKFPDVNDDPATPPVIQEVTAKQAAFLVMQHIGVQQRAGVFDQEQSSLTNEIKETCRQLREGEIQAIDGDGTVYGADMVPQSTRADNQPAFWDGDYDVHGTRQSTHRGPLDDLVSK